MTKRLRNRQIVASVVVLLLGVGLSACAGNYEGGPYYYNVDDPGYYDNDYNGYHDDNG